MTKNIEHFPITALKFDKKSQCLLVGDEFGNVQVWSLARFIDALIMVRVDKARMSRRSKLSFDVDMSSVRNQPSPRKIQ